MLPGAVQTTQVDPFSGAYTIYLPPPSAALLTQ